MNFNSIQTPMAQAKGLGSAKNGTHHWWRQRVTATALVLLTIGLLWTAGNLVGADYHATIAWFQKPWNGCFMILFVGTTFYHMALGLQVVIEDYIHTEWLKITALLVMKFACILMGSAAILSLIKIMFSK